MSRLRTGRLGLAEIRRRLSERDEAILTNVAEYRLLCTRQVEALHFPPTSFSSALSAARCARRVLARLNRDRLLVRLERRVGGVRAGSAGFIHALGPVGHRLLAIDGPRPRLREPSQPFVAHTLAVSQLVVDLMLVERSGRVRIIERQAEPECWRLLPGHGRAMLRPDLFLAIAAGDVELRWFVEVDRGTAHLPTLLRKCGLYETYYRSGVEQATHGVFPRVLWIVPTSARLSRLTDAIAEERELTNALFSVATTENAIDCLLGSEVRR